MMVRPYSSINDPAVAAQGAGVQKPSLAIGMVDLDPLYTHRLSHAAEVGQLVPRVRPQNRSDQSSASAVSRTDRSRSEENYENAGLGQNHVVAVNNQLAQTAGNPAVAGMCWRNPSTPGTNGKCMQTSLITKLHRTLSPKMSRSAEVSQPPFCMAP